MVLESSDKFHANFVSDFLDKKSKHEKTFKLLHGLICIKADVRIKKKRQNRKWLANFACFLKMHLALQIKAIPLTANLVIGILKT